MTASLRAAPVSSATSYGRRNCGKSWLRAWDPARAFLKPPRTTSALYTCYNDSLPRVSVALQGRSSRVVAYRNQDIKGVSTLSSVKVSALAAM